MDILSLGWSGIYINPRFQLQKAKAAQPIQTSNQIVELNYAFQLTPSLFFRPGVQYDIRPGGTSTHPNTWVFDFLFNSHCDSSAQAQNLGHELGDADFAQAVQKFNGVCGAIGGSQG